MTETNASSRKLGKAFGDAKKSVARLMGIKRLGDGRTFQDSVVASDPFVGKREYNKGDLWREPPNDRSSTEVEPPDLAVPSPSHETEPYRDS